MSSGSLRVGMLVGTSPEAGGPYCGVRDYATRLAQALVEAGVEAEVLAPLSWRLRDAAGFRRALRARQFDVVHLQYPSIGHRTSLLPHVLGWSGVARRAFVTLHEHSQLPRVQRAANQAFRFTTDRLMFTTAHEATAYRAGENSTVAPIGSNVPEHAGRPPRNNTVLYFGQIRPGKGLEDFLALARLPGAAAFRFLVIGSTPPRWRGYRDALRQGAAAAWVEDLPFEQVAAEMASAWAAYLPFPDGASLRRGSLLAALSNGLPVIAPAGPGTPEDLRGALLPADSPSAALVQLQGLTAEPGTAALAGRRLAQRFAWPAIAGSHMALYRQALEQALSGAALTAARSGAAE